MARKRIRVRRPFDYVILGVLTLLLLVLTYFYFFHDDISVIEGVVTDKTIPASDIPKYITVGGIVIQTSNHYERPVSDTSPSFALDTHTIKKGDTVEVHYVKTDDKSGTLNCRSCFIKKDNVIIRPTR